MIRRGRKKERKALPKAPTKTRSLSFENGEENCFPAVKRYSSTFDNIKSLLRESKLEPMDDQPEEFRPSVPPPDLVRVVSLPAINDETVSRGALEVTVEEEEAPSDLSDKDKLLETIHLIRLSAAGIPAAATSSFSALIDQHRGNDYLDGPSECDGTLFSPSNNSIAKTANAAFTEEPGSRKSPNASHEPRTSDHRSVSKIPVNLLIEDQIVRKALKENRRQLEKVSDAIKEIESVKNSECFAESKRLRNEDAKQTSKRNSLENEPNDRNIIEGLLDVRSRKRRDSDVDSDTSKTSPQADLNGRKPSGADVIYSSGRAKRQNDVEGHKNDQKQIENVIDAILEESKNPDFQVIIETCMLLSSQPASICPFIEFVHPLENGREWWL